MITRTYKTKDECTHCWLTENWNMIDSTLVTQCDEMWEHWDFVGMPEEDDPYWWDEDEGLAFVGKPIWNTWFEPNVSFDWEWIEAHLAEVASLGFTLIFHDEEFWGLGIDGDGYGFYEAHWIPLYKARGLKWHDED